MTTPPPAAAAPSGDNAAGSLPRLQQQARQRLHTLLRQTEAAEAKSAQAAADLTGRIEQAMQAQSGRPDTSRYGVFLVGSPRRRMVLRGVDRLNGQPPLLRTPNFAEAIGFANQRLDDPLATRPLDWPQLLDELRELARRLAHRESADAWLSGSGTAADPYVCHGRTLRVHAPLALGFVGAPAAQVKLTLHHEKVLATA